MSFTKRHLRYVIELNKGSNAQSGPGSTFDDGSNALNLENLRSVASIQSSVGGNTPFGSSAIIQIWGMKPSDMAQLSTLGFYLNRYNRNKITVFAYSDGNSSAETNATQIYIGNIYTARINYNAMPDVSLELECHATLDQQTQSISGTSAAGASDVASMLQGICAACNPPVTFVNKGVTAKLSNHAVGGSPAHQIEDICMSASICYALQDDTLTIWNNNTNIDGVIVTTGPNNGMVGYPEYNMQGMDITMGFNPEVQWGRQISIVSDNKGPPIPGMPGTYWINVAGHELSSEMPDGPWFTHASVSKMNMAGRT
jgi:hypothetical protein